MPRVGQHYRRAWLLEPTAPEPSTLLMEVAYTVGDDRWDAQDWFHESVRAELDRYNTYHGYMWSMTPRWGGSHRQLLGFAHKCLDTNRWDTIVPSYSFAILHQIHLELGDGYPIGDLPGVLDVVDKCVMGARKALASGDDVASISTTNWAYAAAIYAHAARYEDAHALLSAYGDEMSQRDFNWARVKFTNLRGLCAAMTGPANVDLPALRKWVEEPLPNDVTPDQLDAPLEELERLRALDDREIVQPYWDDVAATLRHLQAYHRGEWVEFALEEGFPGLILIADEHELTEDDTLRIASAASSSGAVLRPIAWFEPPLLVEGEFGAWNGHAADGNWGVYSGWPHYALYGGQELRGVVLSAGRSYLAVTDTQRPEKLKDKHWPFGEEGPAIHHLRLKLWPEQVRHYWQRNWVYIDEEFGRDISGWVCFGDIHPHRANSGQMGGLRVRKLTYEPPPESTSDSAEYWLRELEFDPRDVEPNLLGGIAFYMQEQYEQAERMLMLCREEDCTSAILPFALGATLFDLGRYAEAISELEASVQSGRYDGSPALLSWILSTVADESLRDPERALKLAEEALRIRPDDWRTFRALAAAHARLGDYDQAADWMRQALEEVQDDPDLEKTLAKFRGYLNTIEAGNVIEITRDD